MIQYKQFITKPLILEYLTDNQREKFNQYKIDPSARKATDHVFGVGNDEIHEDLLQPQHKAKTKTHLDVEKHLGREISHDEYHEGRILNAKGQKERIGAKIKDTELRDKFSAEFSQQGVKGGIKTHSVRLVRGPEVAGQTNPVPNAEHPSGHSWEDSSCKNIVDGGAKGYLPAEIKKGAVVGFLRNAKGKELARTTLYRYTNNRGHSAYGIDASYGTEHPAFTTHMQDVARRLSGDHKGGSPVYNIVRGVYNNEGNYEMLHPGLNADDIDKVMKGKSETAKELAISHPSVRPEHLIRAIDEGEDNWDNKMNAALKHPNLPSEKIDEILGINPAKTKTGKIKKYDSHDHRVVLKNPNLTPDHISFALKSKNASIRARALEHPNANEDHLKIGLADPSPAVRTAAMGNQNITKDHITHVLKNEKNTDVIVQALENKNSNKEHIGMAMQHPNRRVRLAAMKQHNKAIPYFDQALKDKDPDVRAEVFENRRATPDHIAKGIKDKSHLVRYMAVKHENATPENLTEVLSNPNCSDDIGSAALRHPKADSTHIDQALSLKNYWIHRSALIRPQVTPEQLTRVLSNPKHFGEDARRWAVEHPNANSTHIDQALRDEDQEVIESAIKNAHAVTPEHINYVLGNKEFPTYVKRAARARLKKIQSGVKVAPKTFEDEDEDDDW